MKTLHMTKPKFVSELNEVGVVCVGQRYDYKTTMHCHYALEKRKSFQY